MLSHLAKSESIYIYKHTWPGDCWAETVRVMLQLAEVLIYPPDGRYFRKEPGLYGEEEIGKR
jgi:hypothetical protein